MIEILLVLSIKLINQLKKIVCMMYDIRWSQHLRCLVCDVCRRLTTRNKFLQINATAGNASAFNHLLQ